MEWKKVLLPADLHSQEFASVQLLYVVNFVSAELRERYHLPCRESLQWLRLFVAILLYAKLAKVFPSTDLPLMVHPSFPILFSAELVFVELKILSDLQRKVCPEDLQTFHVISYSAKQLGCFLPVRVLL